MIGFLCHRLILWGKRLLPPEELADNIPILTRNIGTLPPLVFQHHLNVFKLLPVELLDDTFGLGVNDRCELYLLWPNMWVLGTEMLPTILLEGSYVVQRGM